MTAENPLDDELLALSMFLEPGVGGRLRQLIDAEARVHLVIALEQKVQRAEDLERELRRHVDSLARQLEGRGDRPARILNEPT